MMKRRHFLKLTAVAACVIPRSERPANGEESPPPAAASSQHRLKFGVVTYSLRDLTVEAMIPELKQLGIDSVSVYRLHAPIERGAPDECRTVAQKYRDAGIELASTGVVEVRKDEASMRRAFENARAAGLTRFTVRPHRDSLPLLEQLVKEYDIKVAIHNHGPEDKLYPTPEVAWSAVQPYDRRVGICIDFGHTARAGANPIALIHKCRERLYDFHLKDSLAEPGAKKDTPVEIGRGRLDVRGALAALMEIGYPYQVGYEYDRQNVNLVTGLAESIGYVRGMLSQMRT